MKQYDVIIVGADGANSVVSASFPPFAPNRELAPCAFVIAQGDFYERHVAMWSDRRFPGGYFWYFPKNGEANIGVGARGSTHVRAILSGVLDDLGSRRAFEIKLHSGGVVPVGGLKRRVAWGHV
ncbi:MAG: hypothetical protein GWN84_04850, partial [Gammaproteobacteria bacterium]|nr:hypothetical protein [Gammaproteobacteria bacterium]NIR82303.1 hypothetical protein [Gammaproteobacteria bacterium]NIR91267.1 hypothetical protein [Gammaproteobacteria bacterium]NIU03452.1 hypothetical protein [Gammaproteobacteria bacterium]NIV50887.1 hypothetical protein [Gammaproteobacteria bacterium]